MKVTFKKFLVLAIVLLPFAAVAANLCDYYVWTCAENEDRCMAAFVMWVMDGCWAN